jgi:hypothetical protein
LAVADWKDCARQYRPGKEVSMKSTAIATLRGYRLNKEGRIEKIPGFGLNASAKIAKKKADKKLRLVSRKKAGA